jgi:hypothetical protein
MLNPHETKYKLGDSGMSDNKNTLKESRWGRYCPKCKDYYVDEEGYCDNCHEKTGTPQ